MRACFGKPLVSKEAFRRTRRPIGGRLGSSLLEAKWRAGGMKALRVLDAVKRSAWSIEPARRSSGRARPGKIGRPAASALVQPFGRWRLERRSKIAPEPACQRA